MPLFAGTHVFEAAEPVIGALRQKGALLARGKLVHSYPHSWRSKAPLIFRATPQWFIPMEGAGRLRAKALKAIADTRWVPAPGENRIRGMVESRPDWCISRQRAWGVPIAVFVHKATGEVLRDPGVVERIAAAFEERGTDAWYTTDPAQFLGPERDPADFEQVMDIVDVWFESGSTHATVLEQRPELRWPATLYLEGSDQHRGWFHSSLLESCGTRGRAPYDAVLTHGFVVDAEGRKMSKSQGNVVSPQDLMKTMGADILRLWTVSADYAEDIRIGDEILAGQADAYRRLRNTLRYLLGNLADFREAERLPYERMPELERWVLHRLAELDALVRETNAAFDYPRLYSALHNFCATDLSAFYLDVRKDSLYCDRPDSIRRRAARTVLDQLFACLTAWLAPVLVFTTEEVWLARLPVRGRQRASAAVPGGPGGVARPGARRQVGAHPPGPPRGHRRARGRAPGEADRLLARGGAPGVRDRGRRAPARGGRPRGARDHQRHRGAGGAAPAGAFTLDEVPEVGVLPARASGREVRALLADPSGGRRGSRRRPSCAAAAAMRSRPGPPPDRALTMLHPGLVIAGLVIVLDQLSKWAILMLLDDPTRRDTVP